MSARRLELAAFVALSLAAGSAVAQPVQYEVVPIGGTFDRDVLTGLFVDDDPSAGATSYSCDPFTYDGHNGIDMGIRSFAEKRIGVPVFAAQDGFVTYVYDDDPDENVFPTPPGVQNNIVSIAHSGGTIESEYFHLATNSADAAGIHVGDFVYAGQQIGRVGSSGFSLGPHLHFESRLLPAFTLYDPFAGACNPGPSGWRNQPPLSSTLELTDFGMTTADLSDPANFFPNPPAHQAQLDFADAASFKYWIAVRNLPANAVIDERFYRPDGSLEAGSGFTFPIGYATLAKNDTRWFPRGVPAIAGTWRLEVRIDGQLLIDAPFEVVATKDPSFNRAPEPVSVALDPPAPQGDDVVACRVTASLTLDDLDWDVVRFHYEWTVNGVSVRDVVSAGHADMVPRFTAAPGETLQCKVTPSDGVANGPSASAAATISVGCDPFYDGGDGDGVCDVQDNCPYAANPSQSDIGGIGAASGPDGIGDACQCGDVNGNGRVTTADAVLITRSLLVPPTATLAHPELCDVGGSALCSTADAVITTRALLTPATATIRQQCEAARPGL